MSDFCDFLFLRATVFGPGGGGAPVPSGEGVHILGPLALLVALALALVVLLVLFPRRKGRNR